MRKTNAGNDAPSPVIFYGLSDAEFIQFESHESRPVLLRKPPNEPVWLPPKEARAIFSFARAWSDAPDEAPEGWPFNIGYIQLASAGVDSLPDWAWRGTTVACARGVTAEPIAEYVMAAIFRDSKNFGRMVARDHAHFLSIANENEWPEDTFRAIRGQVLGLVGYGAIGQAIAARAWALGMTVKALRRSQGGNPETFVTSIDELVADADQIVLCAPATPDTRHIIDARVLSQCKPDAHLINVARGSLVDHQALEAALSTGRIRRATLDVTDPEPLPAGHPFYGNPKVALTPHAAWYSVDHHQRLTDKLLANLGRWSRGEELADIAVPGRGY